MPRLRSQQRPDCLQQIKRASKKVAWAPWPGTATRHGRSGRDLEGFPEPPIILLGSKTSPTDRAEKVEQGSRKIEHSRTARRSLPQRDRCNC